MNERIEEIYTQMFAPQPIPQSVIRLYDKVKHFTDRVDGSVITPQELAIIAAVASGVSAPATVPQKATEQPVIAETTGTGGDPYADEAVPAPQTPVAPQTEPTAPIMPQAEPVAPTGPMDAPETPGQRGIDNSKTLENMSKRELYVYATEQLRIPPKILLRRKKTGRGGRVSKKEFQHITKDMMLETINSRKG